MILRHAFLFRLESQGLRKNTFPTLRRLNDISKNNCSSPKSFGTLTEESESRVKYLVDGIQDGNRGCLAEGITLVENEHRRNKLLAKNVLERILKHNNSQQLVGSVNSFRIGLSGPPGAGKSTFIEVVGKILTERGHKVAVLAVDPSSSTTGGSLLGDKTRMPELTKDLNAYIRPSPARGHLGGVTRSTNEAILLCEFGGYDIIFVETVGVGQSEYAVANMVDIFVVLLPPGGGDELQGVKRGIVEKADLLVVTKADGDLNPAAQRTQYEYTASLKFMRSTTPNWKTKVLRVSAKTKEGLDQFWKEVHNFRKATQSEFINKRAEQREIWTWTHVHDGLREMLLQDPRLKSETGKLLDQVREGSINPGTAADEILSAFKQLLKTS